MLDSFITNAGQYIHTNPWLALVAVFVGGILTASNPCVLAMIPLMIGFVAGRRDEKPGGLRAFTFAMVFVLGLSITFTVMGMTAALAGKMYGDVSGSWNWIVAAVCVAMGLHLIGVVTIPIPSLAGRVQPKTRGLLGALVLGLLFGAVSAPCAAPLLVVLLAYLAASDASVAYGGLLLLVYALGHSVLVLVAGTSMGAARALIENRKMTRASEMLRKGAGAMIVAIGFFFFGYGLSASPLPPASSSSARPAVEAPSDQTPGRVESIVFVGQKQACECTRNRIEESWRALQGALGEGADLPVRRIERDVEAVEAEQLAGAKPLMVVPGIYFLDAGSKVIALLQGEVREDEIATLLEPSSQEKAK